MVRNYFSLILFLHLFISGTISAQTTVIPDAAFEQALIDLGIDSDGTINGSVATSDISDVLTLDVSNKWIQYLDGIEDFISLTELYCQENALEYFDISNNINLKILNCSAQNVIDINHPMPVQFDVSNNILLEYLNCSNNRIEGLNITQNPYLKKLICSFNRLQNLNLSNSTNLEYLDCSNNNFIDTYDWELKGITNLNVSATTKLQTLICNNCIIYNLEIGQNLDLQTLNCYSNRLINLNINGAPALSVLQCGGNQLTGLNVSTNTNLENLSCQSNQMTGLYLNKNTNLTYLNCSSNKLEALDIKNDNNAIINEVQATNNPLLSCIQVDDAGAANAGDAPYNNWVIDATATYSENCGNITEIPDVNFEQYLIDTGIDTDGVLNHYVATSDISGLASLNVSQLGISDLTGIEDFISLTNLDCSFNAITSLDVSQLTLLQTLICNDNQLLSLNIAGASALSLLDCDLNQLTNLDVSQHSNLQSLYCYSNQLTSLDLSQNTLLQHLWCQENQLSFLNVKNDNNNMLSIFDSRGNSLLTCIQVDDEVTANAGEAPYTSWEKDDIATYAEDCGALGVDDEILAQSVILYPNPVTNILTIDSEIPITKVEIFSILGKKVKEINSDFKSIPIDNLSNGVYIVKLLFDNGFTTKKLIKN